MSLKNLPPPHSARESQRPPKSPVRVIKTSRVVRSLPFSKIKPPTVKDIGILKKEKQNLIQERSLLKAKITRLVDMTKYPSKFNLRSSTDQNSLEREFRQIEQLSAAKRTEISQLSSSDLAVVVNELQEECLMLYQELVRVRTEKNHNDQQIKELAKELQEVKRNYSPELEKRQAKMIKDLEKQIQEQMIRNCKIKAKLDERENDENEDHPDDAKVIVKQTIDSLEARIQNEKDEIEIIEQELRNVEEKNLAEIEELQRQLDQ